MSTSVKFITSEQRGSPTINGTAGTLIAALDALFTTGHGVTTALSVTVSGGVATAALSSGQSFDRDAVVLVEGGTPSALNGEARVLSTSNTSITWATAAADGAATGTITIKYAPQTSWVSSFAKTNVKEYHSTHVQSNGHHLRVDDTNTTRTRVRGFETMSDIDTGTGPFPTDAQMSGGGYWWKSVAANSTANRWMMFCDERFLIVAIAAGYVQNPTFLSAPARGFGDGISLSPTGDAWATILSAAADNSANASSASLESASVSTSNGISVMPRGFSGLGGSVLCNAIPYTGVNNNVSGVSDLLGAFPSAISGKAYPSAVALKEAVVGSPLRTEVPGVYYLPQSGVAAVLSWGDTLAGSGDLAGHTLVALGTGTSLGSTPSGIYLVDITGPWR